MSSAPPLNSEFSEDLKRLPNVYNSDTEDQYRDFINTYGTHYIYKVKTHTIYLFPYSTKDITAKFTSCLNTIVLNLRFILGVDSYESQLHVPVCPH